MRCREAADTSEHVRWLRRPKRLERSGNDLVFAWSSDTRVEALLKGRPLGDIGWRPLLMWTTRQSAQRIALDDGRRWQLRLRGRNISGARPTSRSWSSREWPGCSFQSSERHDGPDPAASERFDPRVRRAATVYHLPIGSTLVAVADGLVHFATTTSGTPVVIELRLKDDAATQAIREDMVTQGIRGFGHLSPDVVVYRVPFAGPVTANEVWDAIKFQDEHGRAAEDTCPPPPDWWISATRRTRTRSSVSGSPARSTFVFGRAT